MSKGKAVTVDRDRAKTPSVEELYDHFLNGITWTPTRMGQAQVQNQWERLQHELQGYWESHGVPRLRRLLSSQMRKPTHRALEVDHRKQALYRD
ncbi:hypothetical protein F2Q70_00035455 [Brassica cretica]|uniref:Uncharacterized protein n=1 Tax=Brassica cretica TaxID=69181 RepID=A0A8S9K1M1_BRACR|nr:hypothetical protein F2Q70_00035455 [Brassica cretica]